jgi:hypothetical protein
MKTNGRGIGKLGSRTFVNIVTLAGDREKIECIPLGAGGDTLIGSISTDVGTPRPDDGVLQVRGGDTIAAFIDQNLFLSLFDTDLDLSDGAESAAVRLVSRYKEEIDENEPSGTVDLKKLLDDDPAKRYRIRDEITVRLADKWR